MKRISLLLFLSILLISCGKNEGIAPIPEILTPPDSLLKVAGIERKGFTDLQGPISDSGGRLYLYGKKDNNSWFGVFQNDKMIFSKSFEDDPTIADGGYGETVQIQEQYIRSGAQTNSAIMFIRLISDGSGRVGYFGQTVYNKLNNSITDTLFEIDSNGEGDFSRLISYIDWYNQTILTFSTNGKYIYVSNQLFKVLEIINKPDDLFYSDIKPLLCIDRHHFISYSEGNDELYVYYRNLKESGYKWKDKLFYGLADQYRIDTIYGEVNEKTLKINLNVTNKDGSKDQYEKSVNIETGETIE